MWIQFGSKSDYEKEFGNMPVEKLARKIVGLDSDAVNEVFSQFLNKENLNTTQMYFIKMIVDYVVFNRFIEDNHILMQDPFRRVESITQLFKYKFIKVYPKKICLLFLSIFNNYKSITYDI